MNPFVKASQLKTKMPGYAVAHARAQSPDTLQHLASHHREKFLKAFKYVQANVITSITVSRGIASCKYDGISSYFYWEKGQSPFVFHMPACAVEVGLPAAEELAAALERNGNTSALLACELAVGCGRSHSYDVVRLVNSPASRAELEKLHLVTLDVIILDKQEKQGLSYDERVKILQGLPHTKTAHCPDFQEVTGLDSLNAYYRKHIDRARRDSPAQPDHTHRLQNQAEVQPGPGHRGLCGGHQRVDRQRGLHHGRLGFRQLIQLVARVGVAEPGLREKLFQELSGLALTANYTKTDSDGRPIVWVRPVKTMEINAEDALWDDTNGKPWTNTVLQLAGDVYDYQGQGFILKPFHPTLERIREDKPVGECTFKQLNAVDLRLKQSANGKPATVFARGVYTKAVKGNTAVRKSSPGHRSRKAVPGLSFTRWTKPRPRQTAGGSDQGNGRRGRGQEVHRRLEDLKSPKAGQKSSGAFMAACTFNIDNSKHVSELRRIARDHVYGSRRIEAFLRARMRSLCGGREFLKRATCIWFPAMLRGRCAPARSLLSPRRRLWTAPPGRRKRCCRVPSSRPRNFARPPPRR